MSPPPPQPSPHRPTDPRALLAGVGVERNVTSPALRSPSGTGGGGGARRPAVDDPRARFLLRNAMPSGCDPRPRPRPLVVGLHPPSICEGIVATGRPPLPSSHGAPDGTPTMMEPKRQNHIHLGNLFPYSFNARILVLNHFRFSKFAPPPSGAQAPPLLHDRPAGFLRKVPRRVEAPRPGRCVPTSHPLRAIYPHPPLHNGLIFDSRLLAPHGT